MLCNGIGLVVVFYTFTHWCLVTGNLLPNFLTTVTHSFFNIMSSVIPLDKNGGSGEKNAQVKILI